MVLTKRTKGSISEKLRANDVEVCDFGMVDSSEKGYAAAEKIAGAGVDLIMCNMVTYATSSVFAPIIRNAGAPMVLVALQPLKGLDYSKASTFMQLENDNICSVPEFTGVAARLGRKIYDVIIGTLYDDKEADGKFKFVIGEGISKKGPIPPTGNTNTRGFFEPTTKEFIRRWVMEGPTHHYALGIGHHADTIAKIGEILGIETVIVR